MITLGKLTLTSPFVLAPLAGYTDIPFRALCRDHGAGLVFTELISAEGLVRKGKKTLELMAIRDSERPVGIQLFGKDPLVLAEAAKIAAEFSPDLIDINMGCCVPKVTNGGSGAAILKDPARVQAIAHAVKSAVGIPVSAKIRLGWDHSTKNYREVVGILAGEGMNHVAVHGRTRSMYYTGLADWENIAEIASFSAIPVIGNGDIASFEQAGQRLASSGCTAVMIGRKAIGNPWIFTGEEPSWKERVSTARLHFDGMIALYGDYGVILARKHISQYFHGFKRSAQIRGELVTAPDAEAVRAILASIGEE